VNQGEFAMLKSDSEHIIRRAMEDTGAEFDDKQVEALSIMVMKIAGRLVEEAVAAWKPGRGGKPSFYTD
jgi:hypothetical protein